MIGLSTAMVALSLGLALPRRLRVGGVILGVFVLNPLLGIAMLGAVGIHTRVVSIRSARTDGSRAADDGLAALELVGLGVSAGLPFRSAAALTAKQLAGLTGSEIRSALRNISVGQPVAIDDGDLKSMFSVAASSEHSGMPLGTALNALARDSRSESAAAAKERLSKLPVKMLFPLAFLILPGFVMLAVVPPLVSGLTRLSL